MRLYPQMTTAIAIGDFTMISGRSRLKVRIGDSFTITNSMVDQGSTAAYQITRSKGAKVGQGYYIFPSIFDAKFAVE